MAFGRLIDTIKKKKQQEMEEKYPAQNPRTAVSTVVTRKETPQWAAKSSGQTATPLGRAKQKEQVYTPAINRDVNAHKKVENYPLKAEKKKSARKYTELKTTRDPDFVWRAAEGWKSFQTDENRRTLLDRDPGFQRWKAQGGAEETVDWTYKPQKNWSVDENNTFGYLYGKDKQQAYGFAKNLNDLLNKRFDNIGSALEEGARGQAEKAAKLSAEAWSTHTKAQEANSTAQRRSAEQSASIFEKAQTKFREAWNRNAEIQNQNSMQQVQQGERQANAAAEKGKAIMRQAGALAQQQVNAHKTTEDTVLGVYKDFYTNQEWGKTLYETSGVTGSDQTGASIRGYREAAGSEKNSEAFNKEQKQKKQDDLRQQLSEKEVLGLEALGARFLGGGQIVDGYNSALEYAATGKISTTPDITPGEYSQIVDETIADRIEEKGDKFAADVYRFGTKAMDDIAAYAVGGPILSTIRSAAESATDTLWKEKADGATDKEAVTRAFEKGARDAVVDTGAKKLSEYLPLKNGKYLSEEKKREIVGETASSVGKEFVDLDGYKKEFKKQGYSDKQAEHIAIFEAVKKGGMNALDNIALTPVQKKFYDSLRKALSRMS